MARAVELLRITDYTNMNLHNANACQGTLEERNAAVENVEIRLAVQLVLRILHGLLLTLQARNPLRSDRKCPSCTEIGSTRAASLHSDTIEERRSPHELLDITQLAGVHHHCYRRVSSHTQTHVSPHQCERRVVALLGIRNITNVAITVTQIAIGARRGVNHVVLFTFSCFHLVVLDGIH